jgi:MAM domain, meprin/A5/mu/SprB repeat/Putative metal-binding motif/Secretion system C-terminal sorting domain/Proprotein convertase P-domain
MIRIFYIIALLFIHLTAPSQFAFGQSMVAMQNLVLCDAPEFPGALLITDQSATITWAQVSAQNGAQYELEIIETGIAFTGIPNYVLIPGPLFQVSNLLAGKTYKFRVRAQCVGGLTSNWSVESRFRTVIMNGQCGLNLPLADTSCAPATNHFRIKVADVIGSQLGVNTRLKAIRLTMAHTWASDMSMTLVSPNGKRVLIIDSLQTGGNHFGLISEPNCNSYLELSPVCATKSIKEATSPFVGTWLPIQAFTGFEDNSNPNGTWTLEACDRFANDLGNLKYIDLIFESVLCASPPPPVVTNISLSSAQVMIPTGMGCDSLVLEYGLRGFRPGSGAQAGPNGRAVTVPCGTTMRQINGLLPFTEYTVYTRKKCVGVGFSSNSCRTDFYTDCSFATEEETFNTQTNCALSCGATCPISGHWQNINTDQFDWTVTNLVTPTVQTGPDTDFEGTGKYAYIEVSGNACLINKTAQLQSHCITVTDQLGDCDMGFAYHMYGDQIGSLSLEASITGGQSWTTLWSKSGNQGNQWKRQKVDLAPYHGMTILLRFSATSLNGPTGDIAIDNLRFFGNTFENYGASTYYADSDLDGFGNPNATIKTCATTPPVGFVINKLDCNDQNPAIHPNAIEIFCNGIDENCNGMADDMRVIAPVVANIAACAGTPIVLRSSAPVGAIQWFLLQGGAPVFVGQEYALITPATNLTLLAKDTLAGCPGAFDTVYVQSYRSPELMLSAPLSICIGDSISLSQIPITDQNGASATLRFYTGIQLLPSQLVQNTSVSPQAATIYHVLAQTTQGCRDTLPLPISVLSRPSVQIAQGDSLILCKGAESKLSAIASSSNLAPYQYLWSNGLRFQQIPILGTTQVAGTIYSVTVTDAKGCTAKDQINVVTTSSITQTDILQVNGVSQCGLSDGSILLQPIDGVAPYRYQWSGTSAGALANVAGGVSIGQLAAGSYRVTISDSSPNGGCGMVLPLIIVDAPNFGVDTIITTPSTCYGTNTGSISLQITGLSPQVEWSFGNSTTNTNLNLPVGLYSATITEGGCQQVLNDISITQPDSISVAINSKMNVSCFGQSNGAIDLFVSGGTGSYQYLWSNGALTQDLTGLPSGSYTIQITDAKQCVKSLTYTVSQPTPLAIRMDSIAYPKCFGEQNGYLLAHVSGGRAPYTTRWENQITTKERKNLAAGSYTFSVSDSNLCTTNLTQTLAEPLVLEARVSQLQSPSCVGLTNGSIALNISGGTAPYSGLWSDGVIDINRTQLPDGQYHVQISDQNGCAKRIDSLMLIRTQGIPIQKVVTQDIACFGASTGGIDIQISQPSQYNYRINGNVATAQNHSLRAGVYHLDITNPQGCMFKDTITLKQPAAALELVVNSVEQPLCAKANSGSIDILATGGTSPYQYQWSNGTKSRNLQGLGVGAYTIHITDSLGCSAQLSPIQITEPSEMMAQITKVNIPCFGVAVGQIELQVSGGISPYRYRWSTNDSTSAIYQLSAGQYSASITDANNCILELKSIKVEDLKEDFEVAIVKTQNSTCRNQANGSIIVQVNSASGPYYFNWSQPIGLHTQVNPNDTAHLLSPGTYRVTVTNGSGCSAVSPDIVIFNPPTLQVSQATTDVGCSGDSTGRITLDVVGGVPPYQYRWSDQVTDISNRPQLVAGIYRVSVSDFNNCEIALGPFEIKEPTAGIHISLDTLNGGIINDNCSTCKGRIALRVEGGQGNYRYAWSDGSVSQDRENLCVGFYQLTVSDNSACTRRYGPIEIEALSDTPGFDTIRIVNVACKGALSGTISTTIDGGTPPYSVFWDNNMQGDTIVGLPAGLYIATISDAALCNSTFGVLVTEPDSSITVTEQVNKPSGGAMNGSISISVRGGEPPYAIIWSANAQGQTGPDITGLASGIYVATIRDSADCSIDYLIDMTSSTKDSDDFSQVKILPNPVMDILQIESNITFKYHKIYDGTGRIILTGTPDQNKPHIDVSSLQSGFYLVYLQTNEGRSAVMRFVKQ